MKTLALPAQFACGLHGDDLMAAANQRGSIPARTRADVEYRRRRRRKQVNQVAVNLGKRDALVLGGQPEDATAPSWVRLANLDPLGSMTWSEAH